MHLLSHSLGKILIFAKIFLIMTINQSFSQDINYAINAYKRGDYAAALKNFLPLADIDTDYTQLRISENNPTTTPLAQYYLAIMYCQGRGVARDKIKALIWLDKARRGGNALAENASCNK